MNKKIVLWCAFAALALAMAILQFIPAAPVQIPAQLAPESESREAQRLLNFEGIDNFRDLGGHPTGDGRDGLGLSEQAIAQLQRTLLE